jgi:hypothetical protein
MKRYYSVKVHLRPQLRYASLVGGEALPAALVRGLEGAAVTRWQAAPEGGDHLTLEFAGPSRSELLGEFERAAVQVGYALVEAEVEEFVDRAAVGLLAGFLGAGGAAGLTTRNLLVTFLAGAAGAYAGEKAGASARALVASRRYQLHRSGRWIETTPPVSRSAELPSLRPEPAEAFVLP